MINEKYITWSDGQGWITVYTETPEVKDILRKMSGRLTTYERNGRVFAWQSIIPSDKLKFLELQIKKMLSDKELELIYGKFKDRPAVRQAAYEVKENTLGKVKYKINP
jgi:hypothetical protein